MHEQSLFGLMEAVNEGALPASEAGRSAATTLLLSAGVPAERTAQVVEAALTQ